MLDLIARHDIRLVRVSPSSDPDLTALVFIDNAGAAAAMMRHLLALGHRRIGFICGHGSYATSDQRLAGVPIIGRRAGRNAATIASASSWATWESPTRTDWIAAIESVVAYSYEPQCRVSFIPMSA